MYKLRGRLSAVAPDPGGRSCVALITIYLVIIAYLCYGIARICPTFLTLFTENRPSSFPRIIHDFNEAENTKQCANLCWKTLVQMYVIYQGHRVDIVLCLM